jgi:hypothetical protein
MTDDDTFDDESTDEMFTPGLVWGFGLDAMRWSPEQPTPPADSPPPQTTRDELVDTVAEVLMRHRREWRGPTQRELAQRTQAQTRRRLLMNLPIPPDRRLIADIETVLFDQPIDGCEHIGPTLNGLPNLCWWHSDVGLLCDACLVAHNQSEPEHRAPKLTRMVCGSCDRTVPSKDKHDVDGHVATMRRSLPLIEHSSRQIALKRIVDDGIVTITFTGRTHIACAHTMCFACRAQYLAVILGQMPYGGTEF